MKQHKSGFTLVEILMVTGMICLVIALILVTYNGVYRSWASKNTIAAMKGAHLALEKYMLENGSYPVDKDDLGKAAAKLSDKKLFNDLLQECAPFSYKNAANELWIFDDFGPKPPETPNYIYYKFPVGNSFALMSKGKDGNWGGDDDIIYLPVGNGTLKPGFYLCTTNENGTVSGDVEPLAQ